MSEMTHPEQINRDYIRLLQVMRRFVKEEFAVAIRMTQEDAVQQLLHYATSSRNHVLQEMGKELEEFTRGPIGGTETGTVGEGEEHVRYYRGAAIAGERPAAKSSQRDEPKKRPKATRIYRGRVVND